MSSLAIVWVTGTRSTPVSLKGQFSPHSSMLFLSTIAFQIPPVTPLSSQQRAIYSTRMTSFSRQDGTGTCVNVTINSSNVSLALDHGPGSGRSASARPNPGVYGFTPKAPLPLSSLPPSTPFLPSLSHTPHPPPYRSPTPLITNI